MPPSYTFALTVAAVIILWQAYYICLLSRLVEASEKWSKAAADSAKSANTVCDKALAVVDNNAKIARTIEEQHETLLKQNDLLLQLYEEQKRR